MNKVNDGISTRLLKELADRDPDIMPPPGFSARVSVAGIADNAPARFQYELKGAGSFNHCAGICAATGALMLAQGHVTTHGVFAPEDCLVAENFLRRLVDHGIGLRETRELTHDLLGRDRGHSLRKQQTNF